MIDEKTRASFLAKVAVAGGLAAFGLWALWGGLHAFRDERGTDAFITCALGVVFGGLCLRTAWKITGEK